MIYLIALNHLQASRWCQAQDPPINPNSRDILIVTNSEDAQRLRGRTPVEGDRIVEYGQTHLMRPEHYYEVFYTLKGINRNELSIERVYNL